jgi:hypothetical protein
MKFSITTASVFALAFLSSAVKADSYSDAIAQFCDGTKKNRKKKKRQYLTKNILHIGLNVTAPLGTDVFVAGNNATITVCMYFLISGGDTQKKSVLIN